MAIKINSSTNEVDFSWLGERRLNTEFDAAYNQTIYPLLLQDTNGSVVYDFSRYYRYLPKNLDILTPGYDIAFIPARVGRTRLRYAA